MVLPPLTFSIEEVIALVVASVASIIIKRVFKIEIGANILSKIFITVALGFISAAKATQKNHSNAFNNLVVDLRSLRGRMTKRARG